ncbi:MAG: nitroreductase family protein [Bacillota bacterium]
MQIDELIRKRRSVRRFEDRPVSAETVETLLEMAQWAPSAGNRQPWHFYVVQDSSLREQLAEAAGGQQFIAEAPVTIVVCADPERSAGRYGERGRSLYCLQDTAAAVQNILLTVEYMGLGACWIGAFDEQKCSQVLSVPSNLRPVAMIPVGHPAGEARTPRRRPLEDIVTRL